MRPRGGTYTVTLWPSDGMEAATTAEHPTVGAALAEDSSLLEP
jgi:hypothetical protein